MKNKTHILILLIAVSTILSSLTVQSALAQENQTCEQCGMVVDATSQAHFKVVDSSGNTHYVECMMCALKLLSKYESLNITTYCDYSGPSSVIIVTASQKGAVATVTPSTALVIAGGGCAKNRVVSSPSAAAALLANNGTSEYLAAIQKYTNGANGTLAVVPLNATIMTVAKAALQFGGGTPSPSPSPSVPPTQICEQCGMNVAADGQAHFKIVDREGNTHYACCIKCAIKTVAKLGEGNITTNCDWYGVNFPITVSIKQSGQNAVVNPPSAMIIDGSCTKNRVAYDLTAANALLANNGSSRNLIASQNTTIPSNSTIMSLDQAVKTYGVGSSPSPTPSATPSPYPSPTSSPEPSVTPSLSPSPSAFPSQTPESSANPSSTPTPTAIPTPSPSQSSNPPTQSPLPTATTSATPTSNNDPIQICEACGMDVSVESQARYRVTDGNGNVHYVECFMCALNLANDYESLHIETYCDWYGPNYPIVIDTSNYGNTVNVSPSTAMFVRGGSCVTARAAYDQTAADQLLASGYSQYTSPEQQFALPSGTTVTLVRDSVLNIAKNSISKTDEGTRNTTVLIAGAVVGIAVVAAAIVAFKKLKK
jgi:hypothetical protein